MAYGAILSPKDERDFQAKERIAMGVRPRAWEPSKFAPVLSQGQVGSCVAHALATLKWYQEKRERKSEIQYSTDFIYHNRLPENYQGEGMIVREAISQLHKCGVCELNKLPTNTDYPNAITSRFVQALKDEALEYKISNYVRCQSKEEICEAIYQYGGAILVIEPTKSFDIFYMRNRENWILPVPKPEELGGSNHAICAIGYTEDGIIIQNSWGQYWGYNGLAVIPWNFPVLEAWTVVDYTKEWDIIEMTINNPTYIENGVVKTMDTPPQIINNRTMIPVRLVSEALGADVEWLQDEQKIIIRKER